MEAARCHLPRLLSNRAVLAIWCVVVRWCGGAVVWQSLGSPARRRWASNGPHKPVKMHQLSRHLAQKLFAISARGFPRLCINTPHSPKDLNLSEARRSLIFLHSVCWPPPPRQILGLATRGSVRSPRSMCARSRRRHCWTLARTAVHVPTAASFAWPRLTSLVAIPC